MSPGGPSARELAVSVGMFLLTFASAVASYGVFFGGEGDPFADPGILLASERLRDSVTFASCLLGILLAHEMGHYVVARMHGFALSLPLFVPFPNLFGTLGAIIRLRSPPRSRQALLEMAVAGPLAGAGVAFGLLVVALPWTLPAPPLPPGAGILVFADPLVVRLIGTLVTGAPPDALAMFHPAAMAAWVGCFLTGVNLLPIGQLDGGHVLNATVPRVASRVSRYGPLVLVAGGWWWPGWFVFGALLFFLAPGRPLRVPDAPALPARARILAIVAAVLFVLTFLPVPVRDEIAPADTDAPPGTPP